MNERLNLWWRGRTTREQRLILAMLALASAILLWLLVVRPLNDALAQARERHGAAVIALAEARAQAAAITLIERAPRPALPGPVDALINAAAIEAGFPVRRVEREGVGQATLTMDAVRPQAFFGWVGQMERDRGLIVERLRATTNSDQSLAVQVTFRARTS